MVALISPSGDCDCDGNQDDVLGVCGGDCTADADSDGICDDVDDCVGTPDACGICNGPGTIYDCGCFDTPEGDCDCDGNQLDALGVCGGDCTADVNLNGICDNEEAGCDDPDACNYDLDAPPYNPPSGQEGYCLELRTIVEHTSGDLMGMTTYRVHLHTENSTDFISAVSGDSANTMSLLTTSDFYQNPFGGAFSASINPLLYPSFPSLQYDSWLTIGAVDNSSSVDFIGADFIGFEAGDNLVIDSPVGSIWFLLNGDVDGLPLDDGTVLLAQLTTDGQVSGNMYIQVFPEGSQGDYFFLNLPIGGDCTLSEVNPACTYPTSEIVDCDGVCLNDEDGDGVCDGEEVGGCQDASACNFDEAATDDDGSCLELDECGVCGGTGIPAGDCDCEGNQEDAIGVCGGTCILDADQDGVCDTNEVPGCTDTNACNYDFAATDDDGSCLSEDACGICGGPGDIYECGCSDIPEGDCDCNGNQEDALNVCGGDCAADADQDGVCDDVDDCIGTLDICGVCNGPGEVYECGCADIPEGDCDCEGSVSEEVTVTIIPDNFGSEIAWSIQDELGDVLMSGGPYVNGNTDTISVTSFLCTGCYTFSILDGLDDGICCDWGPGEYSVSAGGELVISGTGQYLGNESIGFCLGQQPACGLTGSYSGELGGDDVGAEVFLPFETNASIDSIEFILDFDGPGGDSWASDLGVVITNASGEGALPTWPSDWNSASAGLYSFTLPGPELQDILGEAPGIWSIQVFNSYGPNPPGQYDLTYAIYLECSGCTDPLACNYDSTAAEDDGSCIDPDPVLGCCSTEVVLEDVLSGGAFSDTLSFEAEGAPFALGVVLDWTDLLPSTDDPDASDLLLTITDPNGNCASFGGFNLSVDGCTSAGDNAIWPDDWNVNVANYAQYTDTLNLEGTGLEGSGTWSVVMGNGWSESGPVSYGLSLALEGLCFLSSDAEGCTDQAACNFDVAAIVDDGTCVMPDPISGCTCEQSISQTVSLLPTDTLGTPAEFLGSGFPGPTLLEVELDFTNIEANPNSWPSDMVVRILSPDSTCLWFGGWDANTPPLGCSESDELNVYWPASWNTPNSGQYSAAVDLSDASIMPGTGQWSVTMFNGWSGATNGGMTSSPVIYDVDWTLTGVCDISGCTDEDAVNYLAVATQDDGSCLYGGCTDGDDFDTANGDFSPIADNYDPTADIDDDSCQYSGCDDGAACNYEEWANLDDGSCDYSCFGCTNELACNFDPAATIEDGSCDLTSCYGCTNPCASNFDPTATIDDNSCSAVIGCMDSSACNYNTCAEFNVGCVYADEDCESCSGQTDGSGVVVVEDTDGDGVCDALEIEGCTDLETPACNYNALATDEDGSCEYCSCILVDLPVAASLGAATVGASTGGYALAGDLSGAFPDVDDPCGLLQYSLGTDDCGALAAVAVIEPGVYEMTVTVTNGVDSLSVPTSLTVEVVESPDACQDKAACNYNEAPPCNYPGQQGDCSDPNNGYAYFKALNPEGTGCSCDSMAGTEIWFESFGADGAAATNPMVPLIDGLINAGYGYSGADETDAVGDNGEWSLDIPADLLDGLNGPELEPNYWGVDSEAGNAYFAGSGLNGYELGWVSRTIASQDINGTFGRLAVQFQAEGQGTGVGDHLQVSILSAEGDSLGGSRLEGGEGGLANVAVLSPLVKVESPVRLEVRGQNDGAGEEWRFDDVRLYGWYEGCTDVRASNYNENASFDDGSCEFVWDTLCALTSGLHCDRIWLDPDGLAGDATDLEAVQLTLDSTKVVRIEPNVNLILDNTALPNGLLCVKGLDLRNGATLFIPDSMTLELMDPFDASLSNGIKGPGRLKMSGGVDWSAMEESAQVTTLGCIELNPDQPISVPQGKVLALSGDLDFPVNQAMTLGGRVNMIGSGNRVIRGHTSKVEHLSIELCDEADVVTVEMDTLVVAERLSVIRGELNMASKTLCFASDSSGTGKLDAIPANAEIIGSAQGVDADVSQFIAPDSDGVTYTGYTLFATSIEGMTVGDLDGVDGFYLAGFPGTQWPNSFSSVLFWDEVNSEFIEPTGMSDPLDDKGGIWIVIAGSQSPTMRSQGALRSHNESTEYTRILTRSASATPVYRGWNFIQNPYQGQLDWEAIMGLNEGIEDQYAIYDTQQQAFQRFGIESLDSLQVSGSRYIQPGNSFWVRVHPDSAETTFHLPPSVIDNAGEGGAYVRNEEEVETEVLLALENAYGTGYMWVRFSEQGSLEYVHRKDASYLPSTQVKKGQLGLELEDNTYMSKLLPEELTASLKVVSRANLETTMRVVRASNGMCARVLDQQTGETLDLIEGEELVFTLPEHEADSGRFVLDVRHWAEAEGRMPSCPGSADGRVEVDIQPGTVANVSLLDSAGQILEQAMASGVVEFSSLWPGQYTVVTTPVSGTFCPKVHRPVTVMPGEQPELLGLNWTPTPCNSNPVDVAFELFGGGTFGWTLSHGDEVVQQGAGSGEVQVAGLEPGQYTLDVDHACLNESVVLSALDLDAPLMEVTWNEVVVSNESAVATLHASFQGQAQSVQWFYLGELVSESVELAMEVNGFGSHEVLLLIESNGCSESKWIEFDVVLDLQGDLDDGWRVQSHGSGWSLSLDAGWAELSWILYDATGRIVASNQHGEGHQIHIPYPTATGAYRIALMNAEGNAQVKSLMAPIR